MSIWVHAVGHAAPSSRRLVLRRTHVLPPGRTHFLNRSFRNAATAAGPAPSNVVSRWMNTRDTLHDFRCKVDGVFWNVTAVARTHNLAITR
ncbi:hypothetical protein [Streptodolium elevatio]